MSLQEDEQGAEGMATEPDHHRRPLLRPLYLRLFPHHSLGLNPLAHRFRSQ